MGSPERLTILIHEWTTGGLAGPNIPPSWKVEGRAMRRSLARDFAAVGGLEVRVGVTQGAREPDDPGEWTTLRLPEGSGIDALLERARRVDYTLLIAPETDGLLAGLTRAVEAAGVRTLGSAAAAVELAGDKLRLMERFRERGVPTPDSRLIRCGEPIPADAVFPAVLKPVDGAGSVQTYYLEDAAGDPRPSSSPLDWLLQPFQAGIAMSASYLVGDDGRPWLVGVGRQRVSVLRGRFHYGGGIVPEACPGALSVLRRAVEAVPGLRGFVGVDFVWEPRERRATVIEINPRPTTSHVGLTRVLPAGRLARAWLAACGVVPAADEELEGLGGDVHGRPPVWFGTNGDCCVMTEAQRANLLTPATRGRYAAADRLALDIGGAHLKAAHTWAGARTVPFEVWRQPDQLAAALSALVSGFPPFDRVAVTMTAELCDCYATKAEGVRAIVDAVEQAVAPRPVRVWGTDGRFRSPEEARREPAPAAAANWLALATAAAALAPTERSLLIDIGSTTTDLIPLERGAVRVRGRTDTERLRSGELVYAGVRRTPVCALGTELELEPGGSIGLAAELFATTHDVFLMLGEIAPDEADRATADGRLATLEHARDRLARMVCADRDAFSLEAARALAGAARERLLDRLASAAERACGATIGRPDSAIVCGSGEFLARRLAERLLGPGRPIVSLADAWGRAASTAACAHALLLLGRGSDHHAG